VLLYNHPDLPLESTLIEMKKETELAKDRFSLLECNRTRDGVREKASEHSQRLDKLQAQSVPLSDER
jgi:hypothetical protein